MKILSIVLYLQIGYFAQDIFNIVYPISIPRRCAVAIGWPMILLADGLGRAGEDFRDDHFRKYGVRNK